MVKKEQTIAQEFNTDVMKKMNSTASHIELFFRGKEWVFSYDELPAYIGRDDEQCQVVVSSPEVSRLHCVLEVHDNQIGITDQSTNGTFIKIGQSESFAIRNSFYPLMGQGHIKLGGPLTLDDSELIAFRMVNRLEKP